MLMKIMKSAGRALFAIALILMLIVVSTGIVHAVFLATSSVVIAVFVGWVSALFCTLTAQDYLFN